MKCRHPDLNALLPNFGWVSKEHIRDTLAKTSQHYQADKCIPMHKHFRSHFPAANVCCLNEWYSMDTFITDIPAFDDGIPGHGGCKMMQIYGGLDSELLTGFPLASESDNTGDNPANILTKSLPWHKAQVHVEPLLFWKSETATSEGSDKQV